MYAIVSLHCSTLLFFPLLSQSCHSIVGTSGGEGSRVFLVYVTSSCLKDEQMIFVAESIMRACHRPRGEGKEVIVHFLLLQHPDSIRAAGHSGHSAASIHDSLPLSPFLRKGSSLPLVSSLLALTLRSYKLAAVSLLDPEREEAFLFFLPVTEARTVVRASRIRRKKKRTEWMAFRGSSSSIDLSLPLCSNPMSGDVKEGKEHTTIKRGPNVRTHTFRPALKGWASGSWQV